MWSELIVLQEHKNCFMTEAPKLWSVTHVSVSLHLKIKTSSLLSFACYTLEVEWKGNLERSVPVERDGKVRSHLVQPSFTSITALLSSIVVSILPYFWNHVWFCWIIFFVHWIEGILRAREKIEVESLERHGLGKGLRFMDWSLCLCMA